MRQRSGRFLLKMALAAFCVVTLAQVLPIAAVFAQVPQPVQLPQQVNPPIPIDDGTEQPAGTAQPAALMPVAELENLAAPIALYPDPLLSQVLVASTYPLEVVEANQWLQRNPGLTGPALTQAAEQQNWDPSVQALVMFPDVLKQLNQDITWTTNLGNAYLAQPQDVMNAVQQLRQRAQQGGQLTSTPQQTVTTTTDAGQPVVVIQPTNPDVIYVPEYDPTWFWGPAVYYPYPRWYYPPRRAGLFFSFGPAINVGAFFGGGWGGWNSWGWRPAWGSRAVFVNHDFINRYHFNAAHLGSARGTAAWSHDAFHRQGVPYSSPALTQRYRGNVQQNLRSRAEVPQRFAPRSSPSPGVFARPAAPAARAGRVPSPSFNSAPSERMGNRQIAPNAPNRNRSAFGGIENGGAARSHIDRGYSSLGAARSAAPPRSAPAPRASSGGRSGGGSSSRHH